MFTLALIDDDIPIHPADFRDEFRVQLKRQIQSKYVDRIIPNVGLCIEFYDFVEIKDAHIYPGDGKTSCGEAYFKVEFHVIVFQPMVDEWLIGSIAGSSQKGLSVSLGFFQDVEIPSVNLRTPYTYDNAHKTWVWQYFSQETLETVNFWYLKDELIRFRVTAIDFPAPAGPKASRGESPMRVVGAVDRDGLGCVSWWPGWRDSTCSDEIALPNDGPAVPSSEVTPQGTAALVAAGSESGRPSLSERTQGGDRERQGCGEELRP
mmetsp:Transcript_122814/g.342204  ORF Transcript_122814/g.342204 Transcript_122814/m.342204 type:complete len:263 (-) Transcript_122814:27-815(-)